MKEFERIANLFSNRSRFEQWSKIERAFIKFIFRQKDRKSWPKSEELLLECKVDPFEVLGVLEKHENEHSAFKGVVLSKSSLLNDPKFIYGIDYAGFVNTGNSLLIKEWNNNFFVKIKEVQKKLKEIAFEYKELVQIGRTHGVHGEPTSFGYRFAITYNDVYRCLDAICNMRKFLEVVVFDFDSLFDPSNGLELQTFIAEELGLFYDTGNSYRVHRGRYLTYLGHLNGLAQIINKQVLDLKMMGSKEIGEIKLDGSLISALSKIELSAKLINEHLFGYESLGDAISLNSECFIKQSEDYLYGIMRETWLLINRYLFVLENLVVDKEKVSRNILKSGESVYSQKVLNHLIKKTGLSRKIIAEDLKMVVSSVGNQTFREALSKSRYARYFSKDEFDVMFDRESYLVNIDQIYKRIFASEFKAIALKKVVWHEWEIHDAIERLAVVLNKEYVGSKLPIVLVAFAERSLVFLGHLMLKLNFPVTLMTFPHKREDLEISDINCDFDLIRNRRMLIVDFLIHKESNLDNFIDKLTRKVTLTDVKICALLKFKDVTDEYFVVNWSAIECEPDDFYAGFGKDCGSSDSCRHLPDIGITI
ncbi:adenylosuccinate lyase [Candidatus Mycoplasma haematohominis]|uniref:Adenylosuccinate lyase n=1 Tax=Candidatus Mycoplasma haematohominis TaxID=1494318 RepID=A0A478FPY5_9MOLU|nr:adenylosuccinate lyase [Candidatus Mycoplasma haemohominis]